MFDKRIFQLLKNQKGQALLIIVLIMVVALTIGLSLASRTIINLRNTQQQASSQKALSAAEAGIEQAIKSGVSIAEKQISTNTTYSTTISQVDGNAPFLLNGGNLVPKDDAIYLWTTPYNLASPWQNPWSGGLTIYWGNTGQDCSNPLNSPAALEVSIITGPSSNPTITRKAFDPCASSPRASSNYFDTATVVANSTTISGIKPLYKATFNVTNSLLVRVNPIYATSYVGASGIPNAGIPTLPSQGKIITSVGTSDNSTQRKITVYQGFPEIPTEFFPYTLFSP